MKRLLFLCLTFCLAACLLVACNPTEPPIETDPDTTAPVAAEPTAEPTEAPTEPPTEEPTEEITEAPTEEVTTDYFEANRIETVAPDPTKFADLTLVDEGYDIYQLPGNGNGGWRYGPSYIYYGDGRVDAYFASGGDSGEWDRITHRSSTDDGKTWGSEKIVVYPTPGSMDGYSCCDPAVIYFDGYYYVGYTSTLNDGGYCNNVFVARSENPDGPFEKWNGSGWGGNPEPIFYFEQSYGYWGIGEPAFVELNGTLYIYYTYSTPMQGYLMLATADATEENWPATIQQHGAVMEKNTDSWDVKYVEDWGTFIGVTKASFDAAGDYIAVYESPDGKSFTLVDAVRENTCISPFSMGLSSRPNGHINAAEDAEHLRIGYAYGNMGWAAWNTRLHVITLTRSNGNDLDAERSKDALDVNITRETEPYGWEEWTMLRTEKDLYIVSLEKGKLTLGMFLRDRYVNGSTLNTRSEDVTFTDYDESLLSFTGLRMFVLAAGETTVTAHYGDLVHVFRVIITETEAEKEALCNQTVVAPTLDNVTIYLGERSIYRPQLRVRIATGDGTVSELYVNDGPSVLTFTGYDESVIAVSDKGVVTARAKGTTEVTIKYGTYTMKVKVTVSDDPADAFFGLGDAEEMNYVSLDFSKEIDRTVLSHFNGCEMTATEDGMKVTVTSKSTNPNTTDPSFKVVYQGALEPIMTENYRFVEIEYRVSPENSSHTTDMEIFIGAGSIMDAQGGYSTSASLICDGEFHTLSIPVSHLNYWKGQLNVIRFDFFKAALAGDSMEIRAIRLTE